MLHMVSPHAMLAMVGLAVVGVCEALALRHGANHSSEQGWPVVMTEAQGKDWPWVLPRTEAPAIFHMHISKVGGCSFWEDSKPFIPHGTGLWSEEAVMSEIKRQPEFGLNPHDHIITLLRDPLAHVYSQYLECADDNDWKGKILPKAMRERYLLDNVSIWLQHFTGSQFTEDDLGCYHPYNFQTRAFLADAAMHHQTAPTVPASVMAAQAKEKMKGLWFVGILEHYQESLCLFHAKVTGGLPDWCHCKSPAFAHYSEHMLSHNVRKHDLSDLSQHDILRAKALTEADRRLYDAAVVRFERELAAVEAKHGVKIMC